MTGEWCAWPGRGATCRLERSHCLFYPQELVHFAGCPYSPQARRQITSRPLCRKQSEIDSNACQADPVVSSAQPLSRLPGICQPRRLTERARGKVADAALMAGAGQRTGSAAGRAARPSAAKRIGGPAGETAFENAFCHSRAGLSAAAATAVQPAGVRSIRREPAPRRASPPAWLWPGQSPARTGQPAPCRADRPARDRSGAPRPRSWRPAPARA
jgi:hypothetical protein